MKKIISIIMVLSMLLSLTCIDVYACEEVVTAASAAMNTNLSNATITVGGENLTFTGNSTQQTAYTEWMKTKVLDKNYEKVRFYLQLSPQSSSVTDVAYVRVVRNHYIDGNTGNHNGYVQLQSSYTLKRGEDAQYVELDMFKNTADGKVYHNNLYIIFTSQLDDGQTASDDLPVIATLAGLEFINYEQAPPKMSVGETDVTTNSSGQVVSTAEVKFSQKMDTATALPTEFSLTAADGSSVANVSAVDFTDSGNKKAVLTFDSLVPFDTTFNLTVSANVKNDCADCDFAVNEETRTQEIVFKTPTDIIIGEGKFYDTSNVTPVEIQTIPAGGCFVKYQVNVRNKYDTTQGGRQFTLIMMLYEDGKLQDVAYDTCTLVPGQNRDLWSELLVLSDNASISAFLWDNPVDMNAIADMNRIGTAAAN